MGLAMSSSLLSAVRWRKVLGAFVLIVFVLVYAFFAMVIADMKVVQASRWVQLLYFAVAGVLWVYPAGLLIAWMEGRRHRTTPSR